MQSYIIVLDTTCATHTLCERRNESKEKKEEKKKVPRPRVGNVTDNAELATETIPPYINRVRLKTKGKSRQTEGRKRSTLQAATAVRGTSSIETFYLLLWSAWCLVAPNAVSFLLSSTVPHPRRGCVRPYKINIACSASTHELVIIP